MSDITKFLASLGISENLIAYPQLKYAIDLAIKNEDTLHRVTKDLYPIVAAQFNTSPVRLERNLRTLIKKFWKHGNRKFFNDISKYDVKRRPRPSHFISTLATYYCRHSDDFN